MIKKNKTGVICQKGFILHCLFRRHKVAEIRGTEQSCYHGCPHY